MAALAPPEALGKPVVLFASIGASGQFNPIFSIAETFAKANPDVHVTFATVQSKEALINKAGMQFLPAWNYFDGGQELADTFNRAGARNVDTLKYWTMLSRSSPMYGDAYKLLRPWMEENKPSLAVCDILAEASIAAAIHTCTPYVINTPTPPYLTFPEAVPSYVPPVGSGISRLPKPLYQRLWNIVTVTNYGLGLVRNVLPLIRQQADEGIPRPEDAGKHSTLVLFNTTLGVTDPRIKLPTKVKFTGAVMRAPDAGLVDEVFEKTWVSDLANAKENDPAAFDLYTWVDQATEAKRPIVFIGLGTIYRLDVERIHAIYHALQSLPVNVVWKLSKSEQGLLPPDAPGNKNFRFLPWIPNLNLLLAHPGVSLFVNHGGGNSMNEGLYFKKPQVLLPVWLDCLDFAIQCNDAGAGVAITTGPKLKQSDFHNAVKKILFDEGHEQFAARAAAIGQEMRDIGGSTYAATLIREVLDESVSATMASPTETLAEPLTGEELESSKVSV